MTKFHQICITFQNFWRVLYWKYAIFLFWSLLWLVTSPYSSLIKDSSLILFWIKIWVLESWILVFVCFRFWGMFPGKEVTIKLWKIDQKCRNQMELGRQDSLWQNFLESETSKTYLSGWPLEGGQFQSLSSKF